MSSYVYSTVVLEGNIHELESLRDTMLNLKDKDYQSTFYDILLQHLGIPTENIHCYGDLQGCEIENGTLMWYDHCNTSPCVDVYKLLERHISGGRIYFECTEFEKDLLCTNDAEGKYFKARYRLQSYDGDDDKKDFEDFDALAAYLQDKYGIKISQETEIDTFTHEKFVLSEAKIIDWEKLT